MDKYEKLSLIDFKAKLHEIDAECDVGLIVKFMQAKSINDLTRDFISLAAHKSFLDFKYIVTTLNVL